MKRNILLLFTFFACITVQGQTPVRLVDLRSEHLDRPIGLDNPVPGGWKMVGRELCRLPGGLW